MTTMKKDILVVDDHPVTRTGMKVLLGDMYPYLDISEAHDGESCLQVLKTKRFDVVVLDLQLPETDTIRLIELIKIKHPHVYILIFSMLSESIYAQRILKAGASGFLSKEASIDEMKTAFDMVFKKKKYLSNTLVEQLANQINEKAVTNPFHKLSHREFEISHLLLKGKSITDISDSLHIKPSTVGTYKARIFTKLNVHSIYELNQVSVLYGLDSLTKNLL